MAKTVFMRINNQEFAIVSNKSGIIRIFASNWQAKRNAIKQIKKEAASFGIKLKKKDEVWIADPKKMAKVEYRLFQNLKKYRKN